jgi:mono/diheme cytochrome c family protein
MTIQILRSYLFIWVSCLLIAACNSEPKSNIESTPTKEKTAETPPVLTTQPGSSSIEPADPALAVGEKLYTENCKVCHNLNNITLIGPGLAGINQRRSQEWLIPWIKNSQKVIASGDKYAVDLFNKHNKVTMPSYDFTDDQIKSILVYIAKNEQK